MTDVNDIFTLREKEWENEKASLEEHIETQKVEMYDAHDCCDKILELRDNQIRELEEKLKTKYFE